MREKETVCPEATLRSLGTEFVLHDKHAAAENAARQIIPWALSSAENLQAFFAGIENLSPAGKAVCEKMCGSQVVRRNVESVPQPETFAVLTEYLSRADKFQAQVAAKFLSGIFLYPSRFYEGSRSGLKRAIKIAAGVIYNFTLALDYCSRPVCQKKAIEVSYDHLLNTQGFNLLDLVGRLYLLPQGEFQRNFPLTTSATIYLNLALIQHLGFESHAASVQVLASHNERLGSKIKGLRRDERLRRRAEAEVEQAVSRIEEIEAAVQLLYQDPGHLEIYHLDPEREPLFNQAVRLKMVLESDQLANKGRECLLADLPGDRKELVFYQTSQAKEVRGLALEAIRFQIKHFLAEKPPYANVLASRELETIIQFLGPDWPEPALRQSCEHLYQQALATSGALPAAGRLVNLRLPEEEYLRRMGMTKILIKPERRGGVSVAFVFGQYRYFLALDKNFLPSEKEEVTFPERLAHLSEKSRLFLLAHAYSYLFSMLHPDQPGEEVLGFSQKRTRTGGRVVVEERIMTLEETKQFLSTTHLRVLPLNHRCRQLEQEEVEERTRMRFNGHSLTDIWSAFIAAQADRNTLLILKTQEPRLAGIVTDLLDRIELRPEQPEWMVHEGRLVMRVQKPWIVLGWTEPRIEAVADELLAVEPRTGGQRKVVSDGSFAVEDVPEQGIQRLCYEVTAVLPPESIQPQEVVCRGAASRVAVADAVRT